MLAGFILWELQLGIALCVLAALSPLLSVLDFVFILTLIVGVALFGIWQES